MDTDIKLPHKLELELWSEKPLFIVYSSWLNNIIFMFAVIFWISFIICWYLINPDIKETLFVWWIIAYIFFIYYNNFKNKRYYVWTQDRLWIYKNDNLDSKERSEFSWNIENISNTELNIELKKWRWIYTKYWRYYLHYGIYMSWIKGIDKIQKICKQYIEIHKLNITDDNSLEYTKNSIVEWSFMNIISKLVIFFAILMTYIIIVLFLMSLTIALYPDYEDFIIWFACLISIFVIYYIYKFIF